jgi:hypothetical protein
MALNTNLALQVYSKRILEGLKVKLAMLKAFSTDLSDEVVNAKGQVIRVSLVTGDAAADWNASSNNYGRTAATLTDVSVSLTNRPIVGFAITAAQNAEFHPQWWEGKAELNANALGTAVTNALLALVTAGNFGDTEADKLQISLATFGRKQIAAMRAKIVKAGINPAQASLNLNPDFFSALLADLDSQVYGGKEAIVGGVIPGLLGFKNVIEHPTYNDPGFVALPSALAVAARVVKPLDTTGYGEFSIITEPDTGMPISRVMMTNLATGDTSMSNDVTFGVSVGQSTALKRLVA